MESRLDFESERASPGYFGEIDLRSFTGIALAIAIAALCVAYVYSRVLRRLPELASESAHSPGTTTRPR